MKYFYIFKQLVIGLFQTNNSTPGRENRFRKGFIFLGLALLLFCSPLYGQTGMVHTRSFKIQDYTRSYKLYVPAAYYTSEAVWPLVINFHGFGIDANFQMNYTRMNSVADTAHFLVVYPQGLPVEDLIFGGIKQGWNVPNDYKAVHDDVAFTGSMINHIAAEFNVDLARVYATGFSNGSQMAFYLAFALYDKIASVGGVGGGLTYALLDSYQPARAMPTLTIFGTRDRFNPFNGMPGVPPVPTTPLFWASANGCSVDSLVTDLPDIVNNDGCTVTLIKYQGCEQEVLFYRINEGGHTWPGSDPSTFRSLGPTNMDINANEQFWNFFRQFNMAQYDYRQHDLKVKSFPKQFGKVPIFANDVAFKVVVSNDGMNDEFGSSVTCEIDSAGTLVYSSTQLADTLKSYENKLITFQDWSTFDAQTYNVSFYTSLSDDENLANDTLKASIVVTNLIDDFENGITRWQWNNSWVATGGSARTGKFGLKNSYLTYANNSDNWIEYKYSFNLSRLNAAHISYWTRHYIQTDQDFGYVEASGDGGQTWQPLGAPYTGTQSSWKEDARSLTAFCGPNFTDVRIRFRFVSDSTGTAVGWYIDDINLYPFELLTAISKEENGSLPQQFVLYDNYPNPFNPETTIEYQLSQAGQVRLAVYNLLGQEVKTLINKKHDAGRFNLVWDGKDNLGKAVPSGVYFYRIQAEGFTETKKMLLLQ